MLTQLPKVGDKVRYIGEDQRGIKHGGIYELKEFHDFNGAYITDDDGRTREITESRFDKWELISEGTSVEASPSVIEFLSNLALRLTKVEDKIGNDVLNPKEADGTTTQSERIESVCNEVRDLLIRKNHDYGDSFSKQYAKYGVMSGLIRMDDKIRRLETLVGGEEAQVSESIEDTIADLAGYALLTLVELRKTTE